jgi:hypothetical protein
MEQAALFRREVMLCDQSSDMSGGRLNRWRFSAISFSFRRTPPAMNGNPNMKKAAG